jgi:hypothetical protein
MNYNFRFDEKIKTVNFFKNYTHEVFHKMINSVYAENKTKIEI